MRFAQLAWFSLLLLAVFGIGILRRVARRLRPCMAGRVAAAAARSRAGATLFLSRADGLVPDGVDDGLAQWERDRRVSAGYRILP